MPISVSACCIMPFVTKGDIIKTLFGKALSLICLPLAAYLLMAANAGRTGWLVWALGLVALLLTTRRFAKHIGLLFGVVAVPALTPISVNTDFTSRAAVLQLGSMALGAILSIMGPYLIMRYIYREDDVIKFERPHHAHWNWHRVGYVLFAALVGYIVLPIWIDTTNHYAAWSIGDTVLGGLPLLWGLVMFGIWEELFFVITLLAILRQNVSFWIANLIQSAIWTTVLYEIGFKGWIVAVVFLFSMLQGYAYKRTSNLGYVLAIHLAVDMVLWMALINARHPGVFDIFVVRAW